jgi:hypothetical protein
MAFKDLDTKHAWDKADRERHPERERARHARRGNQRKHNLPRLYGITAEDYDQMVAAQNGLCACCGGPPNKKGGLCVDHDHNSMKVRELLCDRCNIAISYLESPQVEIWQAYLRKHL